MHLVVTVFLVPLGFNYVTRAYNGRCFNPFLSIAVLLYWIVFLELSLEGYLVLRNVMLLIFIFYYVVHFLYMSCFIEESFDAQSKKCKDPVKEKIKQVAKNRKSRLVFKV